MTDLFSCTLRMGRNKRVKARPVSMDFYSLSLQAFSFTFNVARYEHFGDMTTLFYSYRFEKEDKSKANQSPGFVPGDIM